VALGGAKTHSLRISGEEGNGLGYFVGPAGNFDTDADVELAITAPRARVNGVWDAGKVMIYKLSTINADESGSDGAPLLTLTGSPVGNSYLGASFATSLVNQSASIKPEAMYLSSPGRTSSSNCPPPGPCGGGAAGAPGMNGGYSGPEGAWFEFAFLKLAPALPKRLTGVSTSAKFGSSLAGLPDVDRDGAPDFAIGQSGGRCNGRPFGAISFYSVLDGVISRSICTDSPQDKIGQTLGWLPVTKGLIFGNAYKPATAPTGSDSELYAANTDAILGANSLMDFSGGSKSTNIVNSDWQSISQIKTITVTAIPSDLFTFADPKNMSDTGRVKIFKTISAAGLISASIEKTYNGCNFNDKFGYSADVMPDFTGSGGSFSSEYEFVVGVPGKVDTLEKGIVYILDSSQASGPVCDGNSGIIARISADDVKGMGYPGREGFGSTVIGLPNLGVYDPLGVNFDADAYVYVANTNLLGSSTNVVPEYYIIAVKKDGAVKVVKHAEGTLGSALGAYARQLPDINGDGVADLAICHPGGTGQLGATGHVQIISGKGLTTLDTGDDIMQLLYNPDIGGSNFGVSIEYSDITGDGLDDFVIGANEYDTPLYKDAGAIYIYAMEPVK
jgi:hypothetical protein